MRCFKVFNTTTAIAVVVFLLMSCSNAKDKAIRTAVETQLSIHPQSTLQDLYKSLFQDYFGPGHMVGDTTSAGTYLDTELASHDYFEGQYYEPTGYKGNFYRVNMSVIKEGIISRDEFFDAFVRSVTNIQTISLDEWAAEWKHIDKVVEKMNLSLVDYEADRKRIFSLIDNNQYVMHHSDRFTQAYDPHYRIIRQDIFREEILPLLPKQH